MAKAPSAKELLLEKMSDLPEKLGEARPGLALLGACVNACGLSIYKPVSAITTSSNKHGMVRGRITYMVKKLGIIDQYKGSGALQAGVEQYARSVCARHRRVIYYLIARHQEKAAALKAA